MADWITPIATVVLVAVTARYAFLTSKISEANQRSARSAEGAARQAADLAMASIDTRFEVSPAYRRLTDDPDPEFRSDYFNLGVRVRPIAFNPLIHEVRIVTYLRAVRSAQKGERSEAEGPPREALDWNADVAIPFRIHRGKTRRFYSPTTWVPKDYLNRLVVDIDYSFDGKSVTTYQASWFAPEYQFVREASSRIDRRIDPQNSWAERLDKYDDE